MSARSTLQQTDGYSAPETDLRPFSAFFWLIVPTALLILLVVAPPHALDIAVSKIFFTDGWPWRYDPIFVRWFYRVPKIVPAAIAVCLLSYVATLLARGHRPLSDYWGKRILYTVVAMATAAVAVWWLKETTGVACPWSVDVFGGDRPVTDPAFSFFPQSGNCWPSGHAGSGFVLFALYFALRDRFPKCARAAFAFALLFGLFCGGIRIMQGAHFLSHVLVTGLIDWLITASIYLLFFAGKHDIRLGGASNASAAGSGAVNQRNTIKRAGFGVTGLVFFTALWWTGVFDLPFFKSALGLTQEGFAWTPEKGLLTLVLFAAFLSIGAALATLILALPAKIARVLLAVLALCGATTFTGGILYNIVMDPDMARNFLATDQREALAYVSPRTVLLFCAAAIPPIWTAFAADLPPVRPAKHFFRAGAAVLLLAVGVGFIAMELQSFSGLMRADKSLRYRIAPVNVVWSTAVTLAREPSASVEKVRTVVDANPTFARPVSRPSVLIVAVGETARAANWGLSGYERDTTQALGALNVINFSDVTACGTSTEVSLPCMMSRIGRSDYNREQILAEESLPALLQRAGAEVRWVDNQSGCKGTCQGVPTSKPDTASATCENGLCFDGVFTDELKKTLESLPSDRPTVLFYHFYGQHGPAYAKGSPAARKIWTPECTDPDLGSCTKEGIRNAYDNSIRYTSDVLADLIRTLQEKNGSVSSALLYLSDHGESLGEKGLFLHGAPYMIAPDEQVKVPMVMWMNEWFEEDFGIDRAKIEARAKTPVSQEHLFSTVLGLLKVNSSAYRAEYDITH